MSVPLPESPAVGSTDRLIRQHMIAAFGAGLVPMPVVDVIAVQAVILNLVRLLARRHGVPFHGERARIAVTTLLASLAPVSLGGIVGSSLKLLPVVGSWLGGTGVAMLAAGAVYAAGRLFDAHFASGGTLLTFKAEGMQAAFRREFAAGKQAAQALRGSMRGTVPEAMTSPAGDADTTKPSKSGVL